MASFHTQISSGRRGTAREHSRYIDRAGKHGKREDLAYREHGNLPSWAGNDSRKFWQAADRHERQNGAAYRELVIALPIELDKASNIALAKELANELAGDKPYQLAIHTSEGKLGGTANPHMHLMVSDRVDDGIERSPQQTFSRYNREHPELGGRRKDNGGKHPTELREDMIALRKKAADTINQALAVRGIAARVDHRSLKDQGIDRQPEHHLGPARVRLMSDSEKSALNELREFGVETVLD